jgi:hypothetical protein
MSPLLITHGQILILVVGPATISFFFFFSSKRSNLAAFEENGGVKQKQPSRSSEVLFYMKISFHYLHTQISHSVLNENNGENYNACTFTAERNF